MTPSSLDSDDVTIDSSNTSAPRAESFTAGEPSISGKARTIALICLLAASFMELMDATVVNVALRTMQVDLAASPVSIQWIVAGYPLTYAVGLILGARLGDRFGRRAMFILGLAAFGLASLACGSAPGPAELVAFRLIQGIAAALMVPQVLSNIQVLYPPAERGKAMGMFTSVIGLAAVTGPILGAVITTGDWFGLAWRPVFLINVPLAVIAICAAIAFIPESRPASTPSIALGSAALLGGSLGAIMLPITLGPENDWPVWGFMIIAVGAAGLCAFGWNQQRTSRRGVEPMVPPALFATRSFTIGLAAFTALMIPTGGYFLVQSLHVQLALGWSVLHAGLMWIPFSVAVPVSAGLAATVLAERFGKRVLQAGGAVFIVGMLLMDVAEQSAHPALWFAVALIVAGLGFGAIVGSAGLLVLNDVPVRLAGAASGVFNTAQALAVAFGAAVVGTVYSSVGEGSGLEIGYRASLFVMMGFIAAGCIIAQTMRPAGARTPAAVPAH
ncbi:MFS transporter [Gordonia aichiensis]|uniref:Putative drug resistance protein n=1 Tax=Gordonia aichiensis NBRC 108223 TaxID=1220583 RepID=L7KND1_9ACTN|nr:MFS transporter [Gordonia aichiensis]GAC49981.1 putative drug resistance protein [Gordonia aichiensis NBRC 108223]